MSCCDELKSALDDIATILNQLRPDIQAMISNSQQETFKSIQEAFKLNTEQRQADLLALAEALKKGDNSDAQVILDQIIKSENALRVDLWNGLMGK